MYIKKTTSQQKGKLLTVVLILFLMLFASLSERVYGISAVVQSYEESSYYMDERSRQMCELFRVKILISIETESDGTWRNDSFYQGQIDIILDWYNTSLCPRGVSLLIDAPIMTWNLCVNQSIDRKYISPYEINKTLISDIGYTRFDFGFQTGSCLKTSVRVQPSMPYSVYNTSVSFLLTDEYRIGSAWWILPDFWITIMTDPQQRLQTEMVAGMENAIETAIVARMETLEKQLDSLNNLLNYIIILFVTSICIYVATSVYFATRKPKTELKTT
jgi:hypothetical protein